MSTYEDKKPLHVKRTTLLETVQKRFDEEKAKRAEAEANRTAARKAAVEAVSALNPDQLTNLAAEYLALTSGGHTNERIEEWAKDVAEHGKFVTKELKASSNETSLEKWLRVLEIASDEEIEIAPTDEIYVLL